MFPWPAMSAWGLAVVLVFGLALVDRLFWSTS
jgi:hypothetical protein